MQNLSDSVCWLILYFLLIRIPYTGKSWYQTHFYIQIEFNMTRTLLKL